MSVMSDPPLSRASAAFEESGEISDSAASGRESQESGENFLCSQGGWRSEAESVIRDVQKFVKKIEIAEKETVRVCQSACVRAKVCICVWVQVMFVCIS